MVDVGDGGGNATGELVVAHEMQAGHSVGVGVTRDMFPAAAVGVGRPRGEEAWISQGLLDVEEGRLVS